MNLPLWTRAHDTMNSVRRYLLSTHVVDPAP
jgi:hypothetical protein